ncbi:MAG: YhjD/YihY/BrkB family envelope integrity protein, partial [Ilumatobacteraceae bacterium]
MTTDPVVPPGDPVGSSPEHAPTESVGRIARLQATAQGRASDATKWANGLRQRSVFADAGFLIYERDRTSAGTVLGSAIAFRLFLFFVPAVVFGVGLIGLFSGYVSATSITDAGSISGVLAANIRSAHEQSTTASLLSAVTGLFLMASAGRSLSKALVASSNLAWSANGAVTAKVKAIVAITGLMMSLILVSFVIGKIRDELGIAVAGLSFGAGFFVYLVLFMLLMATLPRGTTDPGAILPGAAVVAILVVGLQAVSQLYIPNRISGASDLYGGIGVAVVALGWLFIVGRTLSFSFAVNAALFDRFGSLSQPIFSLPVLRLLPRKSARFRSFFGLDDDGRSIPSHRSPMPDDAPV